MAIFVSLFGIYSVVSMITRPQDIRELAANVNLGHIPSGCYYVRGQCTGSESPGSTGSCKPVLVCPTATPTVTLTPTFTPIPTETPEQEVPSNTPEPPTVTPTPAAVPLPFTLNCQYCLDQGASSICLNLIDKTSSCNSDLLSVNNQNRVCIPCKPMPPTPTPYRCIYNPACLDADPPCLEQKPVEGWCTAGPSSITFQP